MTRQNEKMGNANRKSEIGNRKRERRSGRVCFAVVVADYEGLVEGRDPHLRGTWSRLVTVVCAGKCSARAAKWSSAGPSRRKAAHLFLVSFTLTREKKGALQHGRLWGSVQGRGAQDGRRDQDSAKHLVREAGGGLSEGGDDSVVGLSSQHLPLSGRLCGTE